MQRFMGGLEVEHAVNFLRFNGEVKLAFHGIDYIYMHPCVAAEGFVRMVGATADTEEQPRNSSPTKSSTKTPR
jgi:hypothetical protein